MSLAETEVSGEGEADSWRDNEFYLWHVKFEVSGRYTRILSQIKTLRYWKIIFGALVPAIKLKSNTKPYNKYKEVYITFFLCHCLAHGRNMGIEGLPMGYPA